MEKDVPVDKLHVIRENLATTEEEETDDDDSTFAFIFHKFREFFIDNIPVEIVKQLPNHGKSMFICFYSFVMSEFFSIRKVFDGLVVLLPCFGDFCLFHC